MNALHLDLLDLLPADRLTPGGERWSDIGRYDLGAPMLIVRPQSTDEVVVAVLAARRHQVPVVPVGSRTAYWAPLRVSGALVLDVSGLQGFSIDGGLVMAGAGQLVRPLDAALRARGRCLPIHPDAFGDTAIGAMAAIGCTSGIGMARGSFGDAITGLEVVTGSGEVIWTGAAQYESLPPFQRDGLPDLTGLFLASEGAFGVVTRVAFRAPLAPHRVRLRFAVSDARRLELVALAKELLPHEVIDTLRAVRHGEKVAADTWEVDAWVASSWSAAEATARANSLVTRLEAVAQGKVQAVVEPETARRGAGPGYEERWQGPMGAHATFAARAMLLGLDVNAPWATVPALLQDADEVQRAQLARREVAACRVALYFAPDFVNVGVHGTVQPEPAAIAWAHAHTREVLTRWWRLGVVPYRPGRSWPPEVLADVRPEVRRTWEAVRTTLDPDGVFHPDHPLHGARS